MNRDKNKLFVTGYKTSENVKVETPTEPGTASLKPEQKYFADARVSTPAVLPRGVVSNPGSWRSRVSLHDIQEKCRRERIVRLATAS